MWFPNCPLGFLLAARGAQPRNFVLEWFAVALTENGATALPLVADDTTHGDCLDEDPMLVWKPDRSVVGRW